MSLESQRRVIPIRVERPSTLSDGQLAILNEACQRLRSVPGGLLPLLHTIQRALGYVPKDAVPVIADALNLSLAEVHGVLTFYHYFRQQPAGRHVVHLCRAEACQAVGAAALEAHAKKTLAIEFHGTTADGAVSLEPVYCLGNCALGPSIMLDERVHGRMSAERFDTLMVKARSAAMAS